MGHYIKRLSLHRGMSFFHLCSLDYASQNKIYLSRRNQPSHKSTASWSRRMSRSPLMSFAQIWQRCIRENCTYEGNVQMQPKLQSSEQMLLTRSNWRTLEMIFLFIFILSLLFCFFFRTTNHIQHPDSASSAWRKGPDQMLHPQHTSTRPYC